MIGPGLRRDDIWVSGQLDDALLRLRDIAAWLKSPVGGVAALYLLMILPINLLLLSHYLPWLVSEGEGRSFNLNYKMDLKESMYSIIDDDVISDLFIKND